MIANAKQLTLLELVKHVAQVYHSRGFKIKELLMDGEFEYLREELPDMHINLNTSLENEHVGEVERVNRTIKEQTRGIYNTLPFQKLPGRLVVEMVYTGVLG